MFGGSTIQYLSQFAYNVHQRPAPEAQHASTHHQAAARTARPTRPVEQKASPTIFPAMARTKQRRRESTGSKAPRPQEHLPPGAPRIALDPRFILARSYLLGDEEFELEPIPDMAREVFGVLLQQCRMQDAGIKPRGRLNVVKIQDIGPPSEGEVPSMDSALCWAEYGNAMFRAVEKKFNDVTKAEGGTDSIEEDDSDIDEEDVELALELMDTSWKIFLHHVNEGNEWALEQIPRNIRCIGDLYSFRGEFPNAAHSYLMALEYCNKAWEKMKESCDPKDTLSTLEALRCKGQVVELNALVARALLACPPGEDVVCQYNNEDEEDPFVDVIATSAQRLSDAKSFYLMARSDLEKEVIIRHEMMANAPSDKVDLSRVTKEILLLTKIVNSVGNSIKETKDQS